MATLIEFYAIGAVLVSFAVWRGLGGDGQLSRERVEATLISALVWPLALAVGVLYAARNGRIEAERESGGEVRETA